MTMEASAEWMLSRRTASQGQEFVSEYEKCE